MADDFTEQEANCIYDELGSDSTLLLEPTPPDDEDIEDRLISAVFSCIDFDLDDE